MHAHPSSKAPAARRRLALALLALALVAPLVLVAAVPHTFANGAVADADAVNANFAHLSDRLDETDHRNHLVNGNFDLWQRGTSFSTAGYAADRWYLGSGTASRQTVDVPAGSLAAMNVNGAIEQRLENTAVVTLEGKQATFSALVKCTTGSVTFRVFQHATANAIAGRTSVFDGSVGTCDNTFKRFSRTFTVTAGMAKNGFDLGIAVTNGIVAQAMLHEGTVIPRFRTAGRHVADELALAQRYFETSDQNTYSSYGGTNRWVHWTFKVTKRVAPAVTFTPYTTTVLDGADVNRAQFMNGSTGYAGFGNGKADAEIY